MSNFLDAFGTASGILFSWPNILYPIIGTLIAMFSAFLPGVGGTSLAALVLLISLDWDVEPVILIFGAITGGATFMGSITAILFNIPGNAPAAAALLDGYPLAQKGQARTAIAAAATASAVGSVFGVLTLLILLPIVYEIIVEIGPFERVLIGVLGILTVASIVRSAPSRSVVTILLGFSIPMIGTSAATGEPRWDFGLLSLLGGIGYLPVIIGLLTLSEVFAWTKRIRTEGTQYQADSGSILAGMRAVFKNLSLTMRSSVIGTVIGILPGAGGTVASFLAYSHALNTNKKEKVAFGKGNIKGLIAPEAAADSKDGGSLLPLLTLGLPGSEGGVILLAVLTIHGFALGPEMLTTDLPMSLTLILALLFSNILTSVVGVALTPQLAKFRRLDIERFALPLLIITFVSVVHLRGEPMDLVFAVVFGILGYMFRFHDWPKTPFLLAFLLGEFIEGNYALSAQLISVGRLNPFERPASLVLMLLLAIVLYRLVRRSRDFADDWRFQPSERIIGAGFLAYFCALLAQSSELNVRLDILSLLTAGGGAMISGLMLVRSYVGLKAAAPERQDKQMPIRQFALMGVTVALVPVIGVATSMALFAAGWIALQGAQDARPAWRRFGLTPALWFGGIAAYALYFSPIRVRTPWLADVWPGWVF
ncbi:MAG: tripartite tricarboxylate transporter permease [Rhodobacteraceae bacterium]|nr:tripartite tricarboxylate transporter permease [Paracoccaceae bacterium]